MQAPVMILNTNTRRETGYTAQLSTIQAATNIAKIVRTTLGPLSMLKMLLDPMGGIVITNDGNAILREIDVSHPAGKSIIELSRGQDEEVGDGTTSVIILTGEFLCLAEPFLTQQFHPTTIIQGYMKGLQECIQYMKSIAKPVNLANKNELFQLVQATVGTKFSPKLSTLISQLAVDAVLMITRELQVSKSKKDEMKIQAVQSNSSQKDIDIKRYIKIEKIPGGELSDCHVLHGIMINKDVTHSQMRREIHNPRILLLDCPLEYKKGESQVNVEITKEDDWNTLLRLEEEYIENMCAQIVAMKPDIVITEKGVSDLAQHYFVKANITALRRLRKTDNNRLARACGATIVSRADEIQESDIGTLCGKFKVEKIGDEYFSYFTECKDPKACTILLRGGSKDVLNEMERNLHDAMQSARNIVIDPLLVPGGGAVEMACSAMLKRNVITGTEQYPYLTIAKGLEVIPRTLLQNCGADVVRVMTNLRAKHSSANAIEEKSYTWGVDGIRGTIINMSEEGGIWEPLTVKSQTIKTSIEASCMLLRIDDIVSGLSKKKE